MVFCYGIPKGPQQTTSPKVAAPKLRLAMKKYTTIFSSTQLIPTVDTIMQTQNSSSTAPQWNMRLPPWALDSSTVSRLFQFLWAKDNYFHYLFRSNCRLLTSNILTEGK